MDISLRADTPPTQDIAERFVQGRPRDLGDVHDHVVFEPRRQTPRRSF